MTETVITYSRDPDGREVAHVPMARRKDKTRSISCETREEASGND